MKIRTLLLPAAVALVVAAPRAARGGDGDALSWREQLDAVRRIEDDREALAAVAALEKKLRAQESTEAKARLGELLVMAKLPRLGFLAQGAVAMEVLGLFEQVLREEPARVGVRYLYARTCLGVPPMFKKREAGIASLEILVERADREPGSVPYVDAFLLLAKLKPEAAEKTLRVGLRSFPGDDRLRAALKRGEPPAPAALPEDAAELEEIARRAKERFLEALLANRPAYAELDRALAAGQKLHEKDHEYPLYRGLLRLWQGELGPGSRLPAESIELFRLALRLEPEDTRIYGWLGPVLFVYGRATGQPKMVAEGEELMALGVKLNEEQNRFGRALAYAVTNTKPEQVTEDLYRTLDACLGERQDRSRFLPKGTPSAHPSANDTKYAPHNLSGTLYWAGEFFRLRKDTARARDAYASSLEFDGEKTWPYRKLAEERLAHLDGKAGKLTRNPVSCMLCHQR